MAATYPHPNIHLEEAEGISRAEFQERIAAVRAALPAAGLAGLVAFGDCWRGANVTYFTEFRPLDGVSDIANAVFLLGRDGEPTLFVSDQCLSYAASVTTFPVCSFSELQDRLRAFASANRTGTLGLAGAAYIPADLLDRIKAGLGDRRLEPTMMLAEIKASATNPTQTPMNRITAGSNSAVSRVIL